MNLKNKEMVDKVYIGSKVTIFIYILKAKIMLIKLNGIFCKTL